MIWSACYLGPSPGSASHINSLLCSWNLSPHLQPTGHCFCFLTQLPPFWHLMTFPGVLSFLLMVQSNTAFVHPLSWILDNIVFKILYLTKTKNAGFQNETWELLPHKYQSIFHLRLEMHTLLLKQSLHHFQNQSGELALTVQRERHGFGTPGLEPFWCNVSCSRSGLRKKNKTNPF